MDKDKEFEGMPPMVKKWMFGDFDLNDEVTEVLERNFEKVRMGARVFYLRKIAWVYMALSATKMDYSPEEIAEAKAAGNFIEAEDLSSVFPGEGHEVDHLVMSLRDAGFDAGYVNVVSNISLTISIIFVGYDKIGTVTRRDCCSMVEEWDGSMCEVPEGED